MPITITQIISISAITGLISGAIVPLFKPLIDWGIEKRKQKQETRKKLLENCRRIIDGWSSFKPSYFINSPEYSSLKKYLTKELIKDLEMERKNIPVPIGNNRLKGDNYFKSKLLDEITNLEKEWKLI
jgi:hypothetical protein